MQKSTIIATCLLNSSRVGSLEHGELIVRRVFADEFPRRNFAAWNGVVPDKYGEQIVRNVGRAMTINVMLFIEDLT
jgi:hypothetical protein